MNFAMLKIMCKTLQLFAVLKSFLENFPFSSSNARFFISPYNTYLFALKISGFASHRLPEDRNLAQVSVTAANRLSVYDAVKWPRIVLDVAAVDNSHRALARLD
jgi:hypothetical protein